MQYYNVSIKHRLDKEPEHLIGREAYIPTEAHLIITGSSRKTLQAIAVIIDIPKPYLYNLIQGGNSMTDPAEHVIASMLGTLAPHDPIWTTSSVKKTTTAFFMRALLETFRNTPEQTNPQPDCRKHLVTLFKNKRVITERMQNDPASLAEMAKFEGIPEMISPGKVYVLSSHFPTVTHALAAEVLRRYNLDSKRRMTELRAELISDRDTFWSLRRFFDQIKDTTSLKQGWLIELDFKLDDAFSMKVVDEFLLPRLLKIAEKTLVIMTTDSIMVTRRLRRPQIVVIDGSDGAKKGS
jgi:hypothetical protein